MSFVTIAWRFEANHLQIFLPLSFVSSFFGMNTYDIRNMTSNQGLFWIVSGCLTVGVVGFAVFLAFFGGAIVEAFFMWKANRIRPAKPKEKKKVLHVDRGGAPPFRNFAVLDARPNKIWEADIR